MKTFNKGQISCDNCWLAIHDIYMGGYTCIAQVNMSLMGLLGCPGAITDEIVRKAHAAVLPIYDYLNALPVYDHLKHEQLFKTKAEVEALHEMEKTYFAGFESGVRYASEKAAEKEQPLGTVAEPADPPPASEQPKTGMAKIKVKIAMNIDLIAEYFCVINGLARMENDINVYGKEIDNLIQDRDFVKNSHFQLAEKKSALEAEIMEKLMAK